MFWTRNWRGGASRLAVLPALVALFAGGSALAGVTGVELISVASQPDFNPNGSSQFPSISADGQIIAFHSAGSNLVPGDTNGQDDVFVQIGVNGGAERVSRAGDGSQANDDSFSPSISKNGVFVAFVSRATNLVAGDTNGVQDIFVMDRQSGLPERVSVTTGGSASNDVSYAPSISADGRYVAFVSFANNLVAGDSNQVFDVFVRDRVANTTTRVSVDSAGGQSNGDSLTPSISADGRYVAFQSDATNLVAGDANGMTDVFVRDLQGGTTERVSVASSGAQGDGISNSPSISNDGRYVAFQSAASNLVAVDTNGSDVFVRDRQLATTERVSVAGDGSPGNGNSSLPNISGDGRYVTFQSASINLVAGDTNGVDDVFVRDRQLTTTERVSVAGNGSQGDAQSTFPVVSGDGRYVAFQSTAANLVTNDLNGDDIFVRDRTLNATDRVSTAADSTQTGGNSRAASVSATGRYVAFQSFAGNLVTGDSNGTWDIFVRDRQGSATERVSLTNDGSQSNGGSFTPSVSADGRYVAFESGATNLVAGDTNGRNDVFVRDRQSNTTERVSVSGVGIQGNNNSYSPAISADGRFVVFASLATNLVTGDTNAVADIFLRDRQNNATERISISSASTPAGGVSDFPSVSANGRYVVFQSAANNLVGGDTNLRIDIFLRDRQDGTTTRVNLPSVGLQANNDSFAPRISADGRYVGFRSPAGNLVAGDNNGAPDVFVRDRQANTTTRVSLSEGGNELSGSSDAFSLSADGRFVAFTSTAPNAVSGDTNAATDIFVRDRLAGVTVRASVAGDGSQANGGSDAPDISGSGELVVFQSSATNLTADAAAFPGVFAATLTWANSNPTAQDNNYALLQDTTLTVSAPGVLGNDSDPEGGALTAVVAQNPTHGVLTLFVDGSFLYQPDTGYVGADSFTYRAKDSSDAVSGVATVSLTVLRMNQAPMATAQNVAAQGGTAQTITLAGTDADEDPLTFRITSLPQFGTLYVGSTPITTVPVTLPANQVTYRTLQGQATDGFQFTVSDGTVESGAAAVTITVSSTSSLGKVTANGKLPVTGGSAKLVLSATRTTRKPLKGSLKFTDPVSKKTLKSTALTAMVIEGTTAKVFGEGRFVKNGPLVRFMVIAEDLGKPRNIDRLQVELDDGRVFGPALLTGTVKITE